MKITLLLVVLLLASTGAMQPRPEAISFSGKPLFSKPPAPKAAAKCDSAIAAIRHKNVLTEDDYVEIGKQLVGTAQYRLAVENYSEGLKKFPNSYKLLRNRGHRYITLRQLDKCIADLNRAEELIRSETDVMEYGLDGKPTATVRHQIWYHIGVYHYLKKDFAKAAAAFEKAVATAGQVPNVVGASDWLYNCYQRANQAEKAENAIKSIAPEADMDHTNPYFGRIMLYKGVISPEQLINVNASPDTLSVQHVTKMYGLASWYSYKGDKKKAIALYNTILKSDAWPGFAYAASEKEELK